VLVLGWLILPFYFITSGVYRNWPVVDSPDLIARLFVGVGAVGIWDELFFICTVFALLRRHLPDAAANLLQASCSSPSCGSSATAPGGRCSPSRSLSCKRSSSSRPVRWATS
jgi:Kef-type K+ transport system membrane component KefB